MSKELKSVELIAAPASFEKVNSQLTKCRCYVVASGRNANHSDITLEAIERAIPTLLNMPIVARLYKKEDGSGWAVGSHDIEIVVGPEDIDIVDLTVPFGVVPENCNPKIVEVLEPDGLTTNNYLCVDILLWTGRYNILDAAYNDEIYFNQSCELLVDRAHYDEDSFYVIEDFTFSALCLLGKSDDPQYNKLPCFPSCKIERFNYSLDEKVFREQFSLLMQEVKKVSLDSKLEPESQLNPPPTEDPDSSESFLDTEQNQTKKEDNDLSKDTKKTKSTDKKEYTFVDVCGKIKSLLSDFTYASEYNDRADKYIVLSISEADGNVTVVDRENKYSAHKIAYVVTETDEGLVVTLDYENKAGIVIGAVDSTDAVFNVYDEVCFVANAKAEADVKNFADEVTNDLKVKLENEKKELEEAKIQIAALKKHLDVYEAEKKVFAEQKHKELIDTVIEGFKEDMGKYSEYLEYCLLDHYEKAVETVKKELKEIHYNYLASKTSKGKQGKQQFSAIETKNVESLNEDDAFKQRYGDVAKYLN